MNSDGRLKVGVIFGGRSGEHEVSLMSARSVLNALDKGKYAITQIGITHCGEWLAGEHVLEAMEAKKYSRLEKVTILADPTHQGLYSIKDRDIPAHLADLDLVFPVLHGTFGEDGTLQGLLELADLAYVGAGVLGSAVGMDKGVFKEVMRSRGIPVLEYLITTHRAIREDLEAICEKAEMLAPYPLFVKPANLGSSVGVSKVCSRSDLLEGLLEAVRYDRRVIVERGVNGREIEVSVLGNEQPLASVPGEIIPAADFYSYSAKYQDENSQLLIPAPLPEALVARVQTLAVEAYQAIDCAGMARVDFLLDKDSGELYLNELNTIPGFTRISMYPKLWEASGLPYPQLIDRLVEFALERKADRDRLERKYTG